jgi:hypothetical protein
MAANQPTAQYCCFGGSWSNGTKDEAVAEAYGWKAEMSDDEMLTKLLALNLERARAGQ